MAGNGQKTRQEEKAICGLLAKPTIAAAAKYAGVSESTVYRWLRENPDFQIAYAEARRECVRQATARLQQACGQAVQTLMDVQADADSPASARVTAAKAILELAYKAVEIADLDARVAAVEKKAQPTPWTTKDYLNLIDEAYAKLDRESDAQRTHGQ